MAASTGIMKATLMADWGPAIETAARNAAAAIVAVFVAGETLGLLLHRANDALAAAWVRLVAAPPRPPVAPPPGGGKGPRKRTQMELPEGAKTIIISTPSGRDFWADTLGSQPVVPPASAWKPVVVVPMLEVLSIPMTPQFFKPNTPRFIEGLSEQPRRPRRVRRRRR